MILYTGRKASENILMVLNPDIFEDDITYVFSIRKFDNVQEAEKRHNVDILLDRRRMEVVVSYWMAKYLREVGECVALLGNKRICENLDIHGNDKWGYIWLCIPDEITQRILNEYEHDRIIIIQEDGVMDFSLFNNDIKNNIFGSFLIGDPQEFESGDYYLVECECVVRGPVKEFLLEKGEELGTHPSCLLSASRSFEESASLGQHIPFDLSDDCAVWIASFLKVDLLLEELSFKGIKGE